MPDAITFVVVAGALTALYAVLHETLVWILDRIDAHYLSRRDDSIIAASSLSNDVPDGASTESN